MAKDSCPHMQAAQLLEEYRTTLPDGAYVFIGNAGAMRVELLGDECGVRFAFFEILPSGAAGGRVPGRFGASFESMSLGYQQALIFLLQNRLKP
jgi:hypothetical protein